MAIAGLIRLRFLQVAKQSVIGTAVTATRRVPWRGLIGLNPNRTNPDIDEGSLDPITAPYLGPRELDLTTTGPIIFDELPVQLSAALKGGVTPTGGGTAKTWTYQLASLTADSFDYFTIEAGDDTEATDTTVGFGAVIDTFEETMPEDHSPWTFSHQWVFAGGSLGNNGTDSLGVDDTPVFAFGTDTTVYMDTVPGSIGITPLVDAVHGASIRVTNNLDLKRFANGSNSRFTVAGYGRGEREIELTLTLAKTAATIAEANTLDDSPVPARYFDVNTVSTELAQAANPYKYSRRGAFRLFAREDGEIGGNATITLTYRAFYDSTLTYAYRAQVVNQLTALP